MAAGHGKVILLGEHAVVYGRPAIAGALDRGVEAAAVRAEGRSTLTVPEWDARVAAGDGSHLGRALEALLRSMDRAPEGVAVTAAPRIPAGVGLGCSAALGVAVARAIAELDGRPLGDRLRDATLAWETVFHGNPSGVDAEVAATGAVGLFVKGKGLRPLWLARPLPVAIGVSGQRSSTKERVAALAREKERRPAQVEEVFDGIEALVRDATRALETDDLHAVGTLMDLNQTLLASLGLSTEALDDLCAAARATGAWGCKLTGAGGGGAVVALARDPDAILAAWTRAGYEGFPATLGGGAA